MRCKLSAQLYIRVDRELRLALREGAEAAGVNVSAFARHALRSAIRSLGSSDPDGGPSPSAPSMRQAA
jgi:post-segregation antitoxin (ccd killing protein)